MMMNLRKCCSTFLRLCIMLLLGVGCSQFALFPENIPAQAMSYHSNSRSMEPNINSGDMLIIDPNAYLNNLPERGDIIIFTRPNDPDSVIAKRIVGLPGENIEIKDHVIWIDGQQLEEVYAHQFPLYSGRWTMGEEEYFVLGDKRNSSSDSHSWGALPSENIMGKVTHICPDDNLRSCQEIEYGD